MREQSTRWVLGKPAPNLVSWGAGIRLLCGRNIGSDARRFPGDLLVARVTMPISHTLLGVGGRPMRHHNNGIRIATPPSVRLRRWRKFRRPPPAPPPKRRIRRRTPRARRFTPPAPPGTRPQRAARGESPARRPPDP